MCVKYGRIYYYQAWSWNRWWERKSFKKSVEDKNEKPNKIRVHKRRSINRGRHWDRKIK